MKRSIVLLLCCVTFCCMAHKVSVDVVDRPAAEVFRDIMRQTDKNFIYSSGLLRGMRVTLHLHNKPLRQVLKEMFSGTDIEFTIKGNNVVLKRRPHEKREKVSPAVPAPNQQIFAWPADTIFMLDEVEVVSRLEEPVVESVEMDALKLSAIDVRNTPALGGESDVIKTLQMQPGVAVSAEGMAGMHVHGGNADENMYMLENVPLYNVNHFAGLFSAFNTDIIRYIDFFKTSMPARFDGRLSSFMDVRLDNGTAGRPHGSARLGLTSGAVSLSGGLGDKTTYMLGLRRSWYDVLTIPALAIINAANAEDDDKIRFHYYFMDLNVKLTHRFSNRASGFVSLYFGDDCLKTGSKTPGFDSEEIGWFEDDNYKWHWGNLLVQAGLNYRFPQSMSAEFTAAYTRYFSSMRHNDILRENNAVWRDTTEDNTRYSNNIQDWILRGDFTWSPRYDMKVRFGAGYTHHLFLPSRMSRTYLSGGIYTEAMDSTPTYRAEELNMYAEDDWRVSDCFRVNVGLHGSLFHIGGHTKYGLSPRLALNLRLGRGVALKAAYSRTVQYVHQLAQSYLSLPTDRWLPVASDSPPQRADKIAAGVYWQSDGEMYAISAGGYYKWMNHLVEYDDEYYLLPPMDKWDASLVCGRGTSKGLDVSIEKCYGKFTGRIAYSLSWSDRTFADKNGGHTYPARFDNRHAVTLTAGWQISKKVRLNALWTGHSGNRVTLLTQVWQQPDLEGVPGLEGDPVPLKAPLNNYRLPFYHRLDLSCRVDNSHGYWTFGLYNAYNHLNTVGIRRGYKDVHTQTDQGVVITVKPVYKKIKMLPIIPSISYTWQF